MLLVICQIGSYSLLMLLVTLFIFIFLQLVMCFMWCIVLESKCDNFLQDRIDKRLLCSIHYIRGCHILCLPVVLQCSHAVCLRCMFDLIGQQFLPDSSCCINCIKSLGFEELNEMKETTYDFYKKNLSDKMFYLHTVSVLQSSLDFLRDIRK